MAAYVKRLYTDVLREKASFAAPLPGCVRAIYVANGMATVRAGDAATTLSPNSAFFSTKDIDVTAGADGCRLLRYEVLPKGAADILASGDGVTSIHKTSAEIELTPGDGYLLRCDRVDIPPSGIAYTHVHQGPGIRCLLEGGFTVETGGKTHHIAAGEPWFEAGPVPVLAYAPDDKPGNFSRVMILPRALKGKSSISYVNEEDKEKPKRQRYTIFLDEFITV
jgi:quercetin dioxygenase-like cupin family protein